MDLPSKYGVSVLLSPCRLLQLWHHLVSGSVVLLSFGVWTCLPVASLMAPCSCTGRQCTADHYWDSLCQLWVWIFVMSLSSSFFLQAEVTVIHTGWSHLLLSCSSRRRYFMSFTISQRTVSVYHIQPMKRIFLQIVWGISVISLALLNFFPNIVPNTMKLK